MSEKTNNIRFYLSANKPGFEKVPIDAIKDYLDIPGDIYTLEERGYFSVTKNSKVTFYQTGYEYLMGIRSVYGPSTKVRFIIEEKDDRTLSEDWVRTSDTFVNMYTLSFGEEDDNRTVECELVTGGDLKIMEASFSDEFDVMGVGAPALPYVNVRIDPRLIFRRSKLVTPDDTVIPSSPLDGGNPHFTVPLNQSFSSDDNISGTGMVTMYGIREASGSATLNFIPGGCFYFNADRNRTISVNFQGEFSVKGTLGTGDRIEFFLMVFDEGDDLNFLRRDSIFQAPVLATPGGGPFVFDETREVDVLEGQSLAFAVRAFNLEAYNIEIAKATIITREDSTFPTTYARAVKPFDMFQHLAGRIMGDAEYKFMSGLFGPGGEYENMLLAHGTWLRNVPPVLNEGEDDERRIQANLSMESLFNAFSIKQPLRWDIAKAGNTNTFTVDTFRHIRQQFTGIKIGQSKGGVFKLTPVTGKGRDVLGENYYRKITIGSVTSGSNYAEVNNLYSICGYGQWSTPHTDSESEYKVETEFRTGAEDVEIQRQLQYSDNPDADAERDDDWFIIDTKVNGAEYEPRKWQDFYEEAPRNVYSVDTNYNWPFHPIELLRGHGYKVSAGLQEVSTENLSNPTGNCNMSLITKRAGEDAITSNEPFPIRILDRPVEELMMVNFTFTMTMDVLDQLKGTTGGVDNKFGVVEIDYGGEKIKGFLYSGKTDKNANFKIIQAAR
jgi:hypothetical protein